MPGSLLALTGNLTVLEARKKGECGQKWGPGMLSWLLLSHSSTWDGKRWNVWDRPLHVSHDKKDAASIWEGNELHPKSPNSKCSWAETL